MSQQRNQQIGQRIRLLRKSLGLSQSALGRQVESSGQNIQKYEAGNNSFLFSKIEEFATVFNQEFQKQGSQTQLRSLTNYLIWGNDKVDSELQKTNLNIETQFRFPEGIEDPIVRQNFIKLMDAVSDAYNNYDKKEYGVDLKRIRK